METALPMDIQGPSPANRARPQITSGMTAEQYVKTTQEAHESQYAKKGPPKWLRWIGDGALAVFPINRLFSAIGLTTGLAVGGMVAKTLTAHDFHGAPLEKIKKENFIPGMLHGLYDKVHGVVKYDPKSLDSKNRWIGYGMWGLFSAGGLLGIKAGTTLAYRNMYKLNKNPEFLEDYVARVSQHQGDMWGWLASLGGIFGSTSGNMLVPVPGFNYGLSLAFRSTDAKDENLMFPGIGKVLSGSVTTLRYGVREGLNELCRYAVNNTSKSPTELEHLSYTVLGQIFRDKLQAEHIQRFVDEVHAVRDKYWQEGGIPKDRRQEALADMKAHFTKRGFEETLEKIGLDSMQIDFLSLKGLAGKASNLVTKNKVLAEQNAFREKLTARRQEREQQAPVTSPEACPDPDANLTTRIFALPGLQRPVAAANMPHYNSHEERAGVNRTGAAITA